MHKYLLLAFALAGCGDNKTIPVETPPDAAPTSHAVVVSGDFTPGSPGVMSVLAVDTQQITQRVAPNGAVGDDPVMRQVGGELFVINRSDGNNVTVLDAATFTVKEQLATGAGSNPYDVAVVGNKIYVPSFGTKGVVVLTRGTTATTTIDLTQFDSDGKPDCVAATVVGSDVYVACERLDQTFKPRGPGKIAVIDSATDTVRTTVTMTNGNPIGTFARLPDDGDLIIPTAPDIVGDATKGCIEKITPGATPVTNGCLVQNLDLGGFAQRLEVQDAFGVRIVWIATSKFPAGYIEAFDLLTLCLWEAPVTKDSQTIVDVAVCPTGELVVADSTSGKAGLRLYNGATELTPSALDIGMTPASSHGLACY
jgi:hypothetical protein